MSFTFDEIYDDLIKHYMQGFTDESKVKAIVEAAQGEGFHAYSVGCGVLSFHKEGESMEISISNLRLFNRHPTEEELHLLCFGDDEDAPEFDPENPLVSIKEPEV